ncbi:F0F1 ATP synthase subunit I [Hahella ganghwensis]|uniref:F0F1 ATP synthase subunit I n=1 Tax=Hahella ganghwensis TaxID=286420 RepID=UPI0003809A45|nr:F0F1 ATP synthase subunit I [Hahella ganghwensis]
MSGIARDGKPLDSAAHSQIKRPPVYRVVIVQAFVTLTLAIVGWSFSSVHGYSALLGGLICTLPNCYFAYRTFAYRGASAARHIVKNFYRAEAVKLGLTALLFGLVFKFVQPLEPGSLFLVFFIVQVVHWFTPLIMARAKSPAAGS